MASNVKQSSGKPHAVCVPWPTQGHITPMLQLAKLLHHRGFHITFVNTEHNHDRLVESRGGDSLNGLPSFEFMSIPDPELKREPDKDFAAAFRFTTASRLASLRDLIFKLNNDSNNLPVTCIISDAIMHFALDVAEEFGIPDVMLWTASICGLMAYSRYPHLLHKGLIPLKDMDCVTNGYLDTVVEGVPGMDGIRLKDFPTHIRTTYGDDFDIRICIEFVESAHRSAAIVFNTFDDLEDQEMMYALSSILPPTYAIGPAHQLVDKCTDKSLSFLQSSLWKEDSECLKWLDSKDPNSVIYVNFGSHTVVTSKQLLELAWGLANSNKNFLWIIRPDLVKGENAVLPREFVNETKERGMMTSWCPQEQVLRHPSIVGFLTHCGWNSMLESISAGVPMICWPFWAENQTNCWYSCNKWGIGMEMENEVLRDKVEKIVVEYMDTHKGKEMKMNAMEFKRKAEEAVGTNGSSQLNLDKLIKDVLLNY